MCNIVFPPSDRIAGEHARIWLRDGHYVLHHIGGMSRKTIVAGHEAIHILEGLEMVDPHVEQRPTRLADNAAELILDQAAGRQPGAGIGEALTFRPPNGTLDAQLKLLDVERLGDVIVGPELETLQLVAALVLLGEEDHGDVAGAHAGAQITADFVAVYIRQHDVQDDEMRQNLLGLLQGFATAVGNIDLEIQAGEIDPKHVGDVDVVFHDQ
jgi:hypothetical protein